MADSNVNLSRVWEICSEIASRRERGEDVNPKDVAPNEPQLWKSVEERLREASESEQTLAETDIDEEVASLPIVPGYADLERIGRGGMGTVYKALDIGFRRRVAIKVLRGKYARNPAFVERFVAEARITGRLQHPGVPPAHQIGTLADDRPFLAMKLIQGKSLRQLLKANEPLDVLAIFEQIAQTIAYAHQNGVIHRDLKPDNIMVGTFGEVLVMDWGLAKRLPTSGQTEADSTWPHDNRYYTVPGTALGTPSYIPPEQARGDVETLDTRCDVFGLGAVLCKMLTGRAPFVGKDSEATLLLSIKGRLDDAYAALDAVCAEPELVALCKHCLQKEPDDRPFNGAEVALAVAGIRSRALAKARAAEFELDKAQVKADEHRILRRLRRRHAVIAACIAALLVLMLLLRARNVEADHERIINQVRKATELIQAGNNEEGISNLKGIK